MFSGGGGGGQENRTTGEQDNTSLVVIDLKLFTATKTLKTGVSPRFWKMRKLGVSEMSSPQWGVPTSPPLFIARLKGTKRKAFTTISGDINSSAVIHVGKGAHSMIKIETFMASEDV